MCKLSIKFTRKIAGVSTQAGVSHPELVTQVRDDQTLPLEQEVAQGKQKALKWLKWLQ